MGKYHSAHRSPDKGNEWNTTVKSRPHELQGYKYILIFVNKVYHYYFLKRTSHLDLNPINICGNLFFLSQKGKKSEKITNKREARGRATWRWWCWRRWSPPCQWSRTLRVSGPAPARNKNEYVNLKVPLVKCIENYFIPWDKSSSFL